MTASAAIDPAIDCSDSCHTFVQPLPDPDANHETLATSKAAR